MFAVDTSMVDSQVAFRLWDEYESSSGVGGGAYARDKNTSARLCAKKGLMREGEHICGTLRYIYKHTA